MSVYSAKEIYHFARLAGFSPDEAVTMTAIALAESSGESGAHNPRGEDSRGLWQINVAAHTNMRHWDLYDPAVNAKAAFQVSGGGGDISPWTTTHGGASARYVAYQAEAVAAARASGDATSVGMFTGTEGYGHQVAAGADAAGAGPVDGPADAAPAQEGALSTFLQEALAQKGDPYVWATDTMGTDPDPDAFDCSELVQWAAARAGVTLTDGSWLQYLTLEEKGLAISAEEAAKTPGALLFSFSSRPTPGGSRPSQAHVAISLGDGRTIEAQSPSTGVDSFDVGDRFQYGALIPGISDGTGGPPTSAVNSALPASPLTPAIATTTALAPSGDQDGDKLTDNRERAMGTLPEDADSDGDNLSDGFEVLVAKTDPRNRDTDADGVPDALEFLDDTNPVDPDSDRDGRVDGTVEVEPPDSDGDRLSNVLEKLLRTNPRSPDSDGDGFVDYGEYSGGFDPADVASNPVMPAAEPADALAGDADPTDSAL